MQRSDLIYYVYALAVLGGFISMEVLGIDWSPKLHHAQGGDEVRALSIRSATSTYDSIDGYQGGK